MIRVIRAALLLLFAMTSPAHALTLAVEDAWEPYANPDGTGMSVDIVRAAFEELYRLTHREVTRALAHLVDAGRLEPAIEQAYLALLTGAEPTAEGSSFREY